MVSVCGPTFSAIWPTLLGVYRVPTPHGKSLIYFSEISRTWNMLENEIGLGKSWKLKCRVLESPGI